MFSNNCPLPGEEGEGGKKVAKKSNVTMMYQEKGGRGGEFSVERKKEENLSKGNV